MKWVLMRIRQRPSRGADWLHSPPPQTMVLLEMKHSWSWRMSELLKE